ncbi:MAG: TetR family transcriptional regulator [Stagnimonas sp.]|nr:TetR family transcriptional regulator [Stagnimonas sp.]
MRSASITQPEVRSQILTAAEKLFRSYGYGKTTVADIARECGMSPANVYRFFESKVAVNEAITEVLLEEVETRAQAIAGEQRPVADRLRKILLEMHGFALERYLNESSVHDLCAKAMDEQWGVIEAHIQRTRALTRSLIEEGMRNGEFAKRDLNSAAACVHNAMMPFCHPQLVAENFSKDQKRQAVLMGEFLVAALKA